MANKKKTNGKDPAVLLYTQDFIVGTISMTHEERGKYILLLCMQHQKGKLTDKDLKSVLTEEDIEVAERFPLHDDGFYYNTRMQMEIANRKIKTDSSRNNGSLGGRPKTTILPGEEPNNNPQVISGLTQTKPGNNPTGNANEDGNVNGNKSKLVQVYNAPDIIEIPNTNVDYMIDETDIELTRPMLERMIDKFISVDSRFKLQSVISEINEDYGGFDNLIEMYLPNDISAQNNFRNKLKQYNNGIYA
jgi:hypothetical protein